MLTRHVNLPKTQHFFLLGPRQTGKSTLVNSIFSKEKLIEVNLLLRTEFIKYVSNPSLIQEIVNGAGSVCVKCQDKMNKMYVH